MDVDLLNPNPVVYMPAEIHRSWDPEQTEDARDEIDNYEVFGTSQT